MQATYRVLILSSEKTVLDDEITSLVAPGCQGLLGVLAQHAPLITELIPGPLTLKYADGREEVYAVSGGFLEFSGNRATILADSLERPGEIDVDRAKAAEQRAQERLKARQRDLDVERAEVALKRALNRLRVSSHWG
jgi:F-type H+-transporting ATPase subunit epsilon